MLKRELSSVECLPSMCMALGLNFSTTGHPYQQKTKQLAHTLNVLLRNKHKPSTKQNTTFQFCTT